MQLASFIHDLLQSGIVTVASEPLPFNDEELQKTKELLHDYYSAEVIHMPFTAPAFCEEAALWAGKYLYRTAQFILLRDQEEEVVKQHLSEYQGTKTPEAIYSADLTLRHLPAMFNFAKGLAPEDVLVTCIRKTAINWPFSSVGMKLPEVSNAGIVLEHPSLRYAYCDRIVNTKDTSRINNEIIYGLIREVLGNYQEILWPELNTLQILSE